jgi:hypothetical protein
VAFVLVALAAGGAAIAGGDPNVLPQRTRVIDASSCSVASHTIGTVQVITKNQVFVNKEERLNKKPIPLRPKDILGTARSGDLNFCLTQKETHCRANYPPAKVQVAPGKNFVLDVLKGKAWCSTRSGDHKPYLAGKAILVVGDPVFGMSVTKARTVVKVFLGAVKVRGNASRSAVVVTAGSQTTVKHGATPSGPKAIVFTPGEKKVFQSLAADLPKIGLKKPDVGDSQALETIFHRGTLIVDLDQDAVGDPRVHRFSIDLLEFLASKWGVKLQPPRPASVAEAATDLAKGTADMFVTSKPADVTAVGRNLRLGDAAGVAAVPFTAVDKHPVRLATRADAGLAAALRRFLITTALQSREYETRYVHAFAQKPRYAGIDDLAFPTPAHASGPATVLHRDFRAVVNGQLAKGLTVESTVKGYCSGPAQATVRSDAWRCVQKASTTRTWDPCFSGISNVVVCPSDTDTEEPSHVVEITLLKSLPTRSGPPTSDVARRLRLADGAICGPVDTLPSSRPQFGLQTIDYVCHTPKRHTNRVSRRCAIPRDNALGDADVADQLAGETNSCRRRPSPRSLVLVGRRRA